MKETSWLKRLLLLTVLMAIAIVATFWMDIQEQFSDFVAPATSGARSGLSEGQQRAAVGYYFASYGAVVAAPFEVADQRFAEGVDGRTIVAFRLRARSAGDPYPTLVVAPLDLGGRPTRTLLLGPSAYAHAEQTGSEVVQIAVVMFTGERGALVTPVSLTLHPLP